MSNCTHKIVKMHFLKLYARLFYFWQNSTVGLSPFFLAWQPGVDQGGKEAYPQSKPNFRRSTKSEILIIVAEDRHPPPNYAGPVLFPQKVRSRVTTSRNRRYLLIIQGENHFGLSSCTFWYSMDDYFCSMWNIFSFLFAPWGRARLLLGSSKFHTEPVQGIPQNQAYDVQMQLHDPVRNEIGLNCAKGAKIRRYLGVSLRK